MTQLTYFPSLDDRARLLHLRKEIGIAAMEPHDRAHLHAYDHGWRRAVLGERTPTSPIDPDGKYADPTMIAAAERMWRAKLGARGQESGVRGQAPTPDDIAHVEAQCNIIRANLAQFAARNTAVFNRTQAPAWTPGYNDLGFVGDDTADNTDLAALHRDLGIVATPHVDEDVEAKRHTALEAMRRDHTREVDDNC